VNIGISSAGRVPENFPAVMVLADLHIFWSRLVSGSSQKRKSWKIRLKSKKKYDNRKNRWLTTEAVYCGVGI
jgi:hypothetical protein